jgi:hypothetical protein
MSRVSTNSTDSTDNTDKPNIVFSSKNDHIRESIRKEKVVEFEKALNRLISSFEIHEVCSLNIIKLSSKENSLTDEIDIGVSAFGMKSVDDIVFENICTYSCEHYCIAITTSHDIKEPAIKLWSNIMSMDKQRFIDVIPLLNTCIKDESIMQPIMQKMKASHEEHTTSKVNDRTFQLELFEKFITKKHIIALRMMLDEYRDNNAELLINAISNLQMIAIDYEGLLDSSRINGITENIMSMYEQKYIDFVRNYLHIDIVYHPDELPFDVSILSPSNSVSDELKLHVLSMLSYDVPKMTSVHNSSETPSSISSVLSTSVPKLQDMIIVVRTKDGPQKDRVDRFWIVDGLMRYDYHKYKLIQTIDYINEREERGFNHPKINHSGLIYLEDEFAFKLNRRHLHNHALIAIMVIDVWEEKMRSKKHYNTVVDTLINYALKYEELCI